MRKHTWVIQMVLRNNDEQIDTDILKNFGIEKYGK